MKVRQTVLAVMLAGMFGAAVPASAGGIPVIDGAHIGQSAMNWMKDLAEQIRQFEQMVAQLEQMEKQFKSMTEGRGMGNMMMDPKFQNYCHRLLYLSGFLVFKLSARVMPTGIRRRA